MEIPAFAGMTLVYWGEWLRTKAPRHFIFLNVQYLVYASLLISLRHSRAGGNLPALL